MPGKTDFLWNDPLFSKPINLEKIRRLIAILLAEMMGTGFFIQIGCSSIVNTGMITSEVSHLSVVSAFVFGIGMALYMFNHISGSILNPCLTVTAMILGHISMYRCLCYILFQCIGGFLGIFFNYLLVPDLEANYCRSRRDPAISPMIAFLMEALNSGVICWALCGLLDKRRIGTIRNLVIKFLVVLVPVLLNVHPLFGSTVNPAFTFGGALVSGEFDDFWIYFFAPLVGAIVIGILYRVLFDAFIEEQAEAKQLYNVVE